MCALMQIKK